MEAADTKRLLLFLVILLHLNLAHFCDVSKVGPGTGKDIEVSVDNLVLGETVDLRCRIRNFSRSQWEDDVAASGSRLIWTEGGIADWSEYEGRELIYDSTAGELILRISNFTINDYGIYRCRCHNNFTYVQYKTCGDTDGLANFCSDQEELTILPSGEIFTLTEYVDSPGTKVVLPSCDGGEWVRINSRGSREEKPSLETVVNSPHDQAKFICISSVTENVLFIFFVMIADYYPLKILYPVTDRADVIFSRSGLVPICASLSSLPNTTTTAVYIHHDGMVTPLMVDPEDNTVALEECGWVTAYYIDDFALSVVENYTESIFTCSVSSPWESLAINFTVLSNRSTPSHVCSTVPQSLPFSSSTLPSPYQPSSTLSFFSPTSSLPIQSAPESITLPSSTLLSSPIYGVSSAVIILTGGVVLAVVVVISILAVVLILLCVCKRRRRHSTRRMYKLPDGEDSFVSVNSTPGFPVLPSLITSHNNDTHHLTNGHIFFTQNGIPVSKQMAKCISGLELSPWLFPYEKLEFMEELGSGAFGVVKKALAHSLNPGEPSTIVAVKMLKDGSCSEDEEKDLISELKVLKHVGAHPNIVCLLGAAINSGQLHVIVEYCCNGNLLAFLRSKRNDQSSPLTARHCVDMAAQVATGMEFLTSKDCIHRDLAARNVLITEDNVLKVADFGLARKIYESVYRPSGGKVPVKWLAPESIIDHIYTAQSDVWSFGIVLWEILTLGRTPYPGKSAETMLRDLEDGYRMPRPPSCPVIIYDVMLKCWQWNSVDRPTFSDLVKQLEEILTADEPALNRTYYNLEVNKRDSTLDSTLCSCEDLLSPVHTCHSCRNTFTTTRVLRSDPAKIFCDDCAQMPEYLSRSSLDLLSTCDEGTIGKRAGRRITQRLHSNDSGVKVSSDGNSDYYLRVPNGQRAAIFARTLAESLQSMCSECKKGLEPQMVSCCDEGSQSIGSICTECIEINEKHKYRKIVSPTMEEISREREEYMKQRMDKLLTSSSSVRPRPKSIDENILLSRRGGGGGGREEEERESQGLDNSKVELRQKNSNDSGIRLMPEPIYQKRISAPPISGNRRLSGLLSPQTPRLASAQTSGCSTPASRLSAHPRNRDIFQELGFEETDL